MSQAKARRAISAFPQMLTYDPERQLLPTAKYLRELGVDPSCDSYAIFFAMPDFEKRIRPLVDFLLKQGYPLTDIIAEPRLLCYSLGCRVRPRLLFARSRWPNGKLPSIPELTTQTDSAFCDTILADEADYVRFHGQLRNSSEAAATPPRIDRSAIY